MSAAGVEVFVGLGSNLEGPEQQVRQALAELDELPGAQLIRHSRLYRSAPLGPADQPDYVNAVALLKTTQDADGLLDQLQGLERQHGRVRGNHWGPRTLDLDILLFGSVRIDTPRLQVPHPQLHRRAFVVVPLHEIAPGLDLPGLGPLQGFLPMGAVHGLRPLPLLGPQDE